MGAAGRRARVIGLGRGSERRRPVGGFAKAVDGERSDRTVRGDPALSHAAHPIHGAALPSRVRGGSFPWSGG